MKRLLPCLALVLLAAGASFAGDGWIPVTTPMQDPRWAPAAVVLQDGATALIVGGYSYATRRCVPTADRFDEKTLRFQACRGRLTFPRDFATATLLSDGKVLVAGGFNTVLGTLNTAEIYDPTTGKFSVLPAHLSVGRELFQATTLRDGRVLLTGGFDSRSGRTQASAEIYDPKTQTFAPTASPMSEDRFGHAAVLLADGRVLVVGGKRWHYGEPDQTRASAEIFDPATGRFHRTHGDMGTPRDRPTATLLADDRVLIAGGQNGAEGPRQAELFDPVAETFSPVTAPLLTPRMAHSAARLPDGRVLLAGGWSPPLQATTPSVELYDPAHADFVSAPPMPNSAHDLALLLFSDGLVLEAGGKQVRDGLETSLSSAAIWRSSEAGVKSP